MNQMDAIRAALTARGETITKVLPKYEQWTRKYAGLRDADGALRERGTFPYWFLSRRGSGFRVGSLSTGSLKVKAAVKAALVAEGRTLPRNTDSLAG